MQKNILLLTHSRDHFTIDRVERAIAERGHRPLRFNTDLFPQETTLSIQPGDGEMQLGLPVEDKTVTLKAEEIYSVWLRKLASPQIDSQMDPLLRKGCIKESSTTLKGFLNRLKKAGWLDPIPNAQQAEDKIYQLQTARSLDIRIPETLITNHPEKVRTFYHQLKGDIIAKMMTPLTLSMKGGKPFVYTQSIGKEDLDELEQLRYSPMVFQERIAGELELRVVYVNGRLFTGAVPSGKGENNPTDWRANPNEKLIWQPFRVPGEIGDQIRKFMQKIGLRFGALDVMLTPAGEYVFLEVNPTGEWGMLERDLDLPISEAIAETLVE